MSKEKIATKDETGGKHDLWSFKFSYMKYMRLSAYLFGSAKPIYDMNEIPAGHEFYAHAKKIAEQLKIDWKTMTHEDSNRIMLALLEDCYGEMAEVSNTRNLAINVTLKFTKE